MNIQIINTSLLGLFFLYLVLLSSNIKSLLGCNVQRLLENNIYINHVIVYLSIFLFTFILGWFLPNSIIVNNKSLIESISNESNYIYNSLIYSLYIYIFFILTTKQSTTFMYTFLILFVILIIGYLLYLNMIDNLNIDRNAINKIFIDKVYIDSLSTNKKNDHFIFLHNSLSIGHILILVNVLLGVYYYYLKQRKEQREWSWLKFIFGTHKCNK